MKLKTILIVASVLLALAALVSFFSGSDGAPESDDPRVGAPLVETGALRTLTVLEVTGEDGDVLRVEKSAAGNWVLPSEEGVPANLDRLRRAVTSLAEAEVVRFVTAREERKEGLDLDRIGLKLEGPNDAVLLDLKIGRTATAGGNYVQFSDGEAVYRISETVSLDTTASGWIDRTPLDFEGEEVKSITVGFAPDAAAQPVTLSREAAEAEWTTADGPEGTTIKTTDLDRLLRNLGTLRATRHVSRSDPEVKEAEAFMRTITVETFAGARYEISAGRRPEKTLPVEPAVEGEAPAEDEEPPEPETEPAGKVFVEIAYTDSAAEWAPLADEYAFEIAEWTFNQLPSEPSALLEFPPPVMAPAPAPEFSDPSEE